MNSFPSKGLKPGHLTSEFWLVVVANVLTQAGALQVPDRYKGFVLAASLLGYALSRGLAKAFPPKDDSTLAPRGEHTLIEPDVGDKGSA